MQRIIIAALVIFCASCTPTRHEPLEAPLASYPFRAVGRSDQGRIIEDLQGTAFVYDDEIRIVVAKGYAAFQSSPTRKPEGLSAGLAFRHTTGQWAGHWGFRKQSTLVPIAAIRTRGDTLLEPVAFRIQGTRGLVLSEHWIAIQQHARRFIPQDGLWHETTRPIDSQSDVFAHKP